MKNLSNTSLKIFTKLCIKFSKNPIHLFGHQYHQYFTSQSSDKIPMTVIVIFLAGFKIKYTPPLFFSQLNIFKHVCSFFCPWLQGSAATHMISLNACWWFDATVLGKEVLKYPRANKITELSIHFISNYCKDEWLEISFKYMNNHVSRLKQTLSLQHHISSDSSGIFA